MKLQQIVGASSVSEFVRSRLERSHFHSTDTARQMVRREFPNHVVTEKAGEISVLVRDQSFAVAVFKQVF
jgi:hypothetical protein